MDTQDTMDSAKSFPERLKMAIGDKSARAFAIECGISPTGLHQYLSGKSEPTRPAIIAIANTAGVDLRWLVTGEGEPSFRDELQVAVTQAIIEFASPGIDEQTAKNHASLCIEAINTLGKGREIVPPIAYIKKIIKLLAMLYDFYDSDNEGGERSRMITDRLTLMMDKLASRGKAKAEKEFEELVTDLKEEFTGHH